MPTPSFCRVIYGNLGCQKIRVLASHASLNHLLYCAEYDLKTGGTTGPLPPPPLFIRYSDWRNPKVARVPTYCPQFLISVLRAGQRMRGVKNPSGNFSAHGKSLDGLKVLFLVFFVSKAPTTSHVRRQKVPDFITLPSLALSGRPS